jgi:hypothetical protein
MSDVSNSYRKEVRELLPFQCAKVFTHWIVLVSSRVATKVVLHPVHEPMTPT